MEQTHRVWHKLYEFLTKNYGKDLYGEWQWLGKKGTKNSFGYRSFNDSVLSERIVGYDVMIRIERYCKKYLPEIKIIRCDDAVHAGSCILLIPHPKMGITVLYIPQCTGIQNHFFLYENHFEMLMNGLKELEYVYKGGIDEEIEAYGTVARI